MGAFESFLQNMAQIVGGGDEPPKSKGKVYASQQQINKDNDFARDFLSRHGAPQYYINNTVVARKVGDPIPQFIGQDGQPIKDKGKNLQTTLPNGVSINDVIKTDSGYGFMHPQQGNWVEVDPQAIYQKYGSKK